MKTYVVVLGLFFCFKVSGQTVKNLDGLKIDTITGKFIAELNSKYLFYTSDDAVIQDNLIFSFTSMPARKISCIYQGDSVFLRHCDMVNSGCKFKPYQNQSSLLHFSSALDSAFIGKENLAAFKRSIFKTEEKALYAVFQAKFIAVNLGSFYLKVPMVYNSSAKGQVQSSWTEKKFSNCFLLLDVKDFTYSSF